MRRLRHALLPAAIGVSGSARTLATPQPRPRGLRPDRRRVERPPLDQLLREIEASSWSAVGRRYGVSDNAVRKWVRQYERERDAA